MKRTLALTLACLTGLAAGSFAIRADAAPSFRDRDRGQARMERPSDAWDAPAPRLGRGHGQRPGHGPGPGMNAGFGMMAPSARKLGAVMFPFWENDEIADELELSEDQIDAMAESHALLTEQLEDTQGSIADAGGALKEEMEKDSPDASTVNELIDELTEATNEKSRIILGHAVVVKNVLTEEQEDELPGVSRELMREFRGDLRDLRQEIRQTLVEGGTLDDVAAVIDSYELPEPLGEIVYNMTERLLERRESRPEDAPQKGQDGQQRNFRRR